MFFRAAIVRCCIWHAGPLSHPLSAGRRGAPTPRTADGTNLLRVPTLHTPRVPGEQVRQELRSRSHRVGARLSGGSCEDCMYSWCCTCCTSIQLARYLGFEEKPYSVCSPMGIQAV